MRRGVWLAVCAVVTACDGGSAVTVSPTAREICEVAASCSPTVSLDECVRTTEAQLDVAVRVGCVSEANAANRCSIDALGPADGGSCTSDLGACSAAYRAYNDCVAENGGTADVSCMIEGTLRYCVLYEDLANDPETTCSSLMGERIDACPTSDVVGTCVQDVSGVGVTMTYYGPLSTGLTTETLAGICADQGGSWSMP